MSTHWPTYVENDPDFFEPRPHVSIEWPENTIVSRDALAEAFRFIADLEDEATERRCYWPIELHGLQCHPYKDDCAIVAIVLVVGENNVQAAEAMAAALRKARLRVERCG